MKKLLSVVFATLLLVPLSGQAQEFFTPPNEVPNVQVVGGDQRIEVSWDETIDEDGIVVGYKLYYGTSSVQTAEDFYDDEILLPVKTSHTLENLQNGTEYFIALTAIDDENNESLTYSKEISAIPFEVETPKIVAIDVLSENEVQVLLSTIVQQPENPQASFEVKEASSGDSVSVEFVQFLDDTATLRFENGSLTPDVIYEVRATDLIKDEEGNSVTAGEDDTGTFSIEIENIPVVEEDEAPQEIEESPLDEEEDIFESFEEETEAEDPFTDLEEDQGSEDDFLLTDPLEDPLGLGGEEDDFSLVDDFVDTDTPDQGSQPLVITPPLNAMNLQVDSSTLKSEGFVTLSWQKAIDPQNLIIDQVIYTRKGLGEFDTGFSIGAETNEIELEVAQNKNYEVRLVTVNSVGLQSTGVNYKFSTHLNKTGPESASFLIMTLLAAGYFLDQRRKRA